MNDAFRKDAAARFVPYLLVGLALLSMGSTYWSCSTGHHSDHCHYHGSTRHCGHHSSVVHHTGVVALITDRPADEIRSLFVTITELTLLSAEVGPQVVYSSREGFRVDLLSLRGSKASSLFEVIGGETPVPSGIYTAVSVHFDDPSIILASGELIDSRRIDLISGGKIEVALEPVFLEPDDLTYVTIDFDAGRSVSFSEKEAQWTIRPLVIARALGDIAAEELHASTDASGVISEVSRDLSSLTLRLTSDRGTVEVGLRPDVIILDANLERVAAESIAVGSPATVRGSWSRVGRLDAHSISIGRTVSLRGVVRSAPPASSTRGAPLTVDLFPGQQMEGPISVLAGAATVVSVDRVTPAGLASLKAGAVVAVTGWRSAPQPGQLEERSITVSASVIDLKGALSDADDTTERVTGLLAAFDPEGRRILVSTDEGPRHVTVSRDASIIGLRKGPEYLSQDPLFFEDLYEGLRIEADVNPRNDTTGFVVATH